MSRTLPTTTIADDCKYWSLSITGPDGKPHLALSEDGTFTADGETITGCEDIARMMRQVLSTMVLPDSPTWIEVMTAQRDEARAMVQRIADSDSTRHMTAIATDVICEADSAGWLMMLDRDDSEES